MLWRARTGDGGGCAFEETGDWGAGGGAYCDDIDNDAGVGVWL